MVMASQWPDLPPILTTDKMPSYFYNLRSSLGQSRQTPCTSTPAA